MVTKYERWQIKVRKVGDRKTFTCPIPGREGQRECHKKADVWLDEGLIDQNIKVGTLFDRMIEELKVNTSKTHWRNYELFGRLYIKPCIGNKRTSELNEQHLQNVITYAYKHPAKKKTLSKKTFNFVKFARKNQITKLYPESLSIPHGAKETNKGTLVPADIEKLFGSTMTIHNGKKAEEWFIYAWRFSVITGMRPGEISGLRNIDIKKGICTIRQAINFDKETTTGKNRNAQRSFVIPSIAQDVLKDQQRMMKNIGLVSPYVFPAPSGEPFIQQTYYKHWLRYREANGISKRTPYEMRHTFFSATKALPARS